MSYASCLLLQQLLLLLLLLPLLLPLWGLPYLPVGRR
jgi:hypothetical protein